VEIEEIDVHGRGKNEVAQSQYQGQRAIGRSPSRVPIDRQCAHCQGNGLTDEEDAWVGDQPVHWDEE